MKDICIIAFLVAATYPGSHAQSFSDLAGFNGTNGKGPAASLVQGIDGNFYGTTPYGGIYGSVGVGTVFKITPGGTLTTLHTFCPPQSACSDGAYPFAGLVQANSGIFYGATANGGENGWDYGTVFKMTASGTLTTLHTFGNADGAHPYGGLMQAANGNLYGTTSLGGANGYGTVFEITPLGVLTTLYNFCKLANCADGASPEGTLVQAIDGNFYGTTYQGGASNFGTVFKLTPSGTLTTLHSFNSSDGSNPAAGLMQGADGNFYGTTFGGGGGNQGTIFTISLLGQLKTLYSFCQQGCTDGSNPSAGLIQATDGNFYGTTELGGANGYYGEVFRITPQGALTTLYSFCNQAGCLDGQAPESALIQATDGNFYGTAPQGGNNGDGTIFSLSLGFSPFVTPRPTSAKVGATIVILGSHLSSTTGVSFNGTPAIFKIVSNSEIKATVPLGASNGPIQVNGSSGALSSYVSFGVKPTILSFSPQSGPVGTMVTINGEALSGSLNVVFGGIKTTNLTASSYTQITVTVPKGAKTGKVAVNTPSGNAQSATNFTVTP